MAPPKKQKAIEEIAKEEAKKAFDEGIGKAIKEFFEKNPWILKEIGGGGKGTIGGGGCFVKGTLVATPHGRIPIEQIKVAAEVYSYDWVSGKLVDQNVLNVTESWEQEILVLNFGDERIRCTPLHRFYTGQWVPAQKLQSGDRVLSQNGRWKVLQDIQQEIQSQPVYNLIVTELHNYLVGQAGLIVHNEKKEEEKFYEEKKKGGGVE
jgi:hypothetical protein